MARTYPPIYLNCHVCNAPVSAPRKRLTEYARKGRAFCSDDCRWVFCKSINSATASNTNKKHASARMKAKNPMASNECVLKMKTTKAANGTLHLAPRQRGGNGKVSAIQQKLADALGWETEHVVTVGMGRGNGYPTHYKIDIAEPSEMIAIEVDGHSHNYPAARERDARKDAKLKELGWQVLRFTNRQVLENLMECVDSVLSVYLRAES
jgi:hypothetical protein